jgi:hypothetical protein
MSENAKEVTLHFVSQNFPRTVVYNRFGFENAGPIRIFYFGLLDEEDYVRDTYVCAIDAATIERQKEDLLDYVARAGTSTPADTPLWRPKAATIASVDLANVIRAARIGPIAEIRLFNYSVGDVLDAQKENRQTVDAYPVVLLRCEEPLQRAMFLSLYAE